MLSKVQSLGTKDSLDLTWVGQDTGLLASSLTHTLYCST